MRHDETRDNTTAIETQSIEADAHVDTREGVEGSDPTGRETWRERKLRLAIATFGPIRRSKPFMDDTPEPEGAPEDIRPIRVPEERHEEHNDGANGYEDDGVCRPEDPEHDPVGDAETEYDIEFDADDADEDHPMGGDNNAWHGGDDDEPEDDGQPTEYEEWQDYMGGDDWDQGQYDEGGY